MSKYVGLVYKERMYNQEGKDRRASETQVLLAMNSKFIILEYSHFLDYSM
jgi:hypothetical protein